MILIKEIAVSYHPRSQASHPTSCGIVVDLKNMSLFSLSLSVALSAAGVCVLCAVIVTSTRVVITCGVWRLEICSFFYFYVLKGQRAKTSLSFHISHTLCCGTSFFYKRFENTTHNTQHTL